MTLAMDPKRSGHQCVKQMPGIIQQITTNNQSLSSVFLLEGSVKSCPFCNSLCLCFGSYSINPFPVDPETPLGLQSSPHPQILPGNISLLSLFSHRSSMATVFGDK